MLVREEEEERLFILISGCSYESASRFTVFYAWCIWVMGCGMVMIDDGGGGMGTVRQKKTRGRCDSGAWFGLGFEYYKFFSSELFGNNVLKSPCC